MTTADLRKGLIFDLDGVPHLVLDAQHIKPGKGAAFCRSKLKNLHSEAIFEKTFRTEKIQPIFSEMVEIEFLYEADDFFHFMDVKTYDQLALEKSLVGDAKNFLAPNMRVKVLMLDSKPTAIELPTFVNLEVTHAEPGVRGDTVSGGTKPVTLETGATLQVPLFIETGQKIRIDTRTGAYVERV